MSCADRRQNRLLSQSRWARRLRSTNETSRSAVRGMPLRENGRPLSWRDLASPPQWRARQCWGPNHTAQRARIGVEFFLVGFGVASVLMNGAVKCRQGCFPRNVFRQGISLGFTTMTRSASRIAEATRSYPIDQGPSFCWGARLTNLQRQTLAIARALLKRSDHTIINEATEGLDIETQDRAISIVSADCEGCGVIWFINWVAASWNSEHVLAMQDGRVAVKGPYEELSGRPGAFKKILKAA